MKVRRIVIIGDSLLRRLTPRADWYMDYTAKSDSYTRKYAQSEAKIRENTFESIENEPETTKLVVESQL